MENNLEPNTTKAAPGDGLKRWRAEQRAKKEAGAESAPVAAESTSPEGKYTPSWKRNPVTFVEERLKKFGAETLQLSPLYLPPEIEIAFARNPKHDDEASIYEYMAMGYSPVAWEDTTGDPIEAKAQGKICFKGLRSGPNNTVLIGSSLVLMWIHRSVKLKRDRQDWLDSRSRIEDAPREHLSRQGIPEEIIEESTVVRQKVDIDPARFDNELDEKMPRDEGE